MQRKYLIILILLTLQVLLLFSMHACSDDKNRVSVRGLVTDPNTGINVSNATVILSASKVQSGVYNAGYAEIGRTTTDEGGAFAFDFDEELVVGYHVYITKDGYFSYMADISSDDMPGGATYEPVYQLFPIGYVKLKVINVAPYDTADFISYSFTSNYLGCLECCDNTMHYSHGMYVNDSLKCKTHGNCNMTVTWNVIKNHNQTVHNGSFYCKAFDTVSYTIIY